jgi:hypothetical protein
VRIESPSPKKKGQGGKLKNFLDAQPRKVK